MPSPSAFTIDPGPLTGADLIARERLRQVDQEGWTLEHDLEHGHGVLGDAAYSYATGQGSTVPPATWPWHPSWWKPKSVIRDLVRAGALYEAALDVADFAGADAQTVAQLHAARQGVADKVDDLLAGGVRP